MKKKKFFLILVTTIGFLAFSGIAYAAFNSGTSFETHMEMPAELQALM